MLTGFRTARVSSYSSRTPLFWIAGSAYSTAAGSLLRWIKLGAPDRSQTAI
jgi:hypothetical protein